MDNTVGVFLSKWRGIDAVTLITRKYEAILLPGFGSNIVRLYDIEYDLDILRTPLEQEMDTFRQMPHIFGIPVLFFPNRIEGGCFEFDGREYQFEVNERASNSHIHGFAHDRPWHIVLTKISCPDTVVVETLFAGNPCVDFFGQFPHEFEIRSKFELSPKGLSHEINVTNRSSLKMPLAIGIHTTFRIPFHPMGDCDAMVLKMGVEKSWELTDVYMNKDKLTALSDYSKKLPSEGIPPLDKPLVGHYTAKSFQYYGREYHGAVLEDLKNKMRVCYETGSKFEHWVLWNDDSKKGFICPEPQTCAINAPNLKVCRDQSGFTGIDPGETWSESTKIYSERIS